MKKDYDIFISYRREGGKEYARNLTLALVSCGYHPFFDFDELKDGKFDKRITDAIESAPVFIFVLTPGSLDRCVNEGDWVRKEILHAIEHKRHIVPVDIDKQFGEFPQSAGFPEAIKNALGQNQFTQIRTDSLFNASIGEMVKYRIQPAIEEHMRKMQAAAGMEGAEIHIETDMDCHVQRFHRDMIVAKVGEENVIHLPKGRHKLQFIAVENPEKKESREFTVEDISESNFIEVSMQKKAGAVLVEIEELNILRKENDALKATIQELQQQLKDRGGKEKRRDFIPAGNTDINMIHVEGGTFTMGEGSDEHQVTLSSFSVSETLVTQELWKEVMGTAPSRFRGDLRPVESVSWNECQKFIKKLNEKTGKAFRLLTEAEWEFASRGGNASQRYEYSGSNNVDDVAWYSDNSGAQTHPVKQKAPNELGLYDMSGNVWEWCQDWCGNYGKGPLTDPTGPSAGSGRVIRGGGWNCGAKGCGSSCRSGRSPGYMSFALGFRLALSD